MCKGFIALSKFKGRSKRHHYYRKESVSPFGSKQIDNKQYYDFILFLLAHSKLYFRIPIIIIFFVVMLPIEKSKDLIQQINRILRRLQHIKQVKVQLNDFITEVQQLSSTFSQKIHKEMIVFEEKVVKYSLYSTQKTNYIINLAKVYREYSIQLEKNAKINIINLQRIKSDDIIKQQQKLKKKCELFLKQFQQYLESQKGYNRNFNIYNNKCNDLDQVIRQFRSYENPIAFYNQTLTNQYIHQLDNKYNDCTNEQTTVINETQGMDQTRKWMSDHVKEINEYYVILLHVYLFIIESIINCIVLPKKEDQLQKSKLGLRNSELDSLENQQNVELQKLNNLYASQLNNQNRGMEDNIIEEYSQLFKKSFAQSELNSDYKFFYDRCDNIRNKKLKSSDEVVRIQSLLVSELNNQYENYVNYQTTYKSIQKDIFTNNGIDSFKKKFRKYFGSNFMEVLELCLTVIDRQKKSMEKIGKSLEDNREKLYKLLQNKKESIKLFEKRTKMILDDHLKLKEKTYATNSVDGQQLKVFKDSIAQSFNQLKKSFLEIQKSQSDIDKLFFSNLKNHYQIILREAVNKNLGKTLQKQKNRLNILRSLNVDSQIVLILKQDSRYEMLLNECPKPNLYSTFQSLIKKRQYDQTKRLLQMKEDRLKNMIRSKKGCCGITSQPIKNNVMSEHNCKLVAAQKKKGILNVTSTGLIFEEKSWNPFNEGLRLMIPQTDISSFDVKIVNDKQAVQIGTDFGNLAFQSKACNEILESMQKNITFKPLRQSSERGKKNDSSSFIKNNTSNQFKLSYDPSFINSNGDNSKVKTNKNNKARTFDAIIKDFVKKWNDAQFFSSSFAKIIKNLPDKSESRRDYNYKNGYSKFYLKERRDHQVQGKDIILIYDWKISFPQSPMLHSFKHNQKIFIEGINKELKVRIVTGKCSEEQLYIKSKFYKEIEDMNTQITKFIVNTFEREADILIEPQNQETKSVDSCNIVIEDINFEDRDSKFETGRNSLRNSRIQRQRSSIQFQSSNGFKNTS